MTETKLPADLAIAQAATIKPILEIASAMGLKNDEIELFGEFKAKIKLNVLERMAGQPNGKYIDVTAITPTPLGEGKTVTTIGLTQGLNHIGKKAIACIRQPSLGPVFGVKGGAAGGGYSQVVPMEDINLHLTGDFHAVSLAHNLLAAYVDNHIMHGNALGIDPLSVTWSRVVDVNDRALRRIIVGLGGKPNGVPRESGFDISAASEVMAILALAEDLFDLRRRLGNIVIGLNKDGQPVTADDLKCAGAMAVLLKDAIKPNLLQTLEGAPCLVHAGPFANIAHGNNSIVADRIALKLGEYVVTESGFGADCGAEKFMDIKCRVSGLVPDAVVLVASIRALKMHGGLAKVVAGKPLAEALRRENLEALRAGSENLEKHIENISYFGVPVVVAVNRFATDTEREIELVREIALDAGADGVETSEVWTSGGPGGASLARAVVKAADKPSSFRFLYPTSWPIKRKIEAIATKMYGASGVDYLYAAEQKIELYNRLGWDSLPVCIAKTQYSLSHDPELKGRPRGFRVPVRDIRASIGAGFIYPLLGEMTTMPGLPSEPAGNNIDIDEAGRTVGLF